MLISDALTASGERRRFAFYAAGQPYRRIVVSGRHDDAGETIVRELSVLSCKAHRKPTEDPMTDDRMALVELLRKSDEGDFLRAVVEAVLQILMKANVEVT